MEDEDDTLEDEDELVDIKQILLLRLLHKHILLLLVLDEREVLH